MGFRVFLEGGANQATMKQFWIILRYFSELGENSICFFKQILGVFKSSLMGEEDGLFRQAGCSAHVFLNFLSNPLSLPQFFLNLFENCFQRHFVHTQKCFQNEASSELNRCYVQFEDFCRIGLQLSRSTSKLCRRHIKRLAKYLKRQHLEEVTTDDIRNCLKTFDGLSPYTYSNALKALRAFFRDFMKAGYLVESFRFPSIAYNPIIVPSKEELRVFYSNLDSIGLCVPYSKDKKYGTNYNQKYPCNGN